MLVLKEPRAYLYLITLAVYFLNSFVNHSDINFLVSILAVASLVTSLPKAKWGPRILAILFLLAGYWLLVNSNAPLATWISAHGSMLPLLALFTVLPVLSVPVDLGQYGVSMETILRSRIKSIFNLNCIATIFAFVCGSFMSLAAIPIMMTSMAPVVHHYPLENKVRFRSVAATYGYVLPILWTPVSGVVGIVVQSLNLKWASLLPLLVAMSVAALFANWGVFYWLECRKGPAAIPNASPQSTSRRLLPSMLHLGQIVLAVAVMVFIIVVIESHWHVGMMAAVTVVSIPFALLWSVAIHKGREFLPRAKNQLTNQLAQMSDQFAIFLAAGFFVSALNLSGLDHALNLALLDFHRLLGTTVFLLLMPLMGLALALVGVHPMIAIALLGESLKPEILGVAPALLAVTLVGSAVFTYMLGPFGGTLGLMQSLTKISTYRLALWNLPYALAYLVILFAVILIY